jgi:hypothetical protein
VADSVDRPLLPRQTRRRNVAVGRFSGVSPALLS